MGNRCLDHGLHRRRAVADCFEDFEDKDGWLVKRCGVTFRLVGCRIYDKASLEGLEDTAG